jgi:peptidoglycan lytic transglycosylase
LFRLIDCQYAPDPAARQTVALGSVVVTMCLLARRRGLGALPPALPLLAMLAVALSACSSGGLAKRSAYDPGKGVSASPRVAWGGSVPKGGGTYKIGAPYQISGRWYIPQEDPVYDRTGVASWYGDDFHGRKTANGEIYDMGALTVAHPTLPLPSYAHVTNMQTGRTVLVRINDRGPYAKGRIIDLSRHAAGLLGFAGQGLAHVRVRYAGRAPLDGSDHREQAFVASQPWYGPARGRRYAEQAMPHRQP